MELDDLIQQSRRADGKFRTTDVITREIRAMYPGYPENPVPELVYMFLNGMDSPKSCRAGHLHTFLSESKGYRPTCGVKGCPYNTSPGRTRNRSEINKASAQVFREKTGLKSPSQLPGVGDKISQAGKIIGKERYEKISETIRSRYGVDSYLDVPGVQSSGIAGAWTESARAARSHTNEEKYGAPNPMQNSDVARRVARAYDESRGLTVFRQMVSDLEWWKAHDDHKELREKLEQYVGTGHAQKLVKLHRPDLKSVTIPESFVRDVLERIGAEFIAGDRSILEGREIDFLLPKYNVGIEVNGIYWHSELAGRRGQEYHHAKHRDAASRGIRLIQFWDAEIYRKPEIVSSIIASACSSNRTVPARKTTVVTLDARTEKEFMNANHIQGYVPSALCFGLESGGELVAAMSFGLPRFSGKFEWELLRYCNAVGINTIGGASKLFARRPPGSIVSYADMRLFTGGMYRAIGMTADGSSRPSYKYTANYADLESRVKYQKHKLAKLFPECFDAAKTEWEIMMAAGYDRVWDCGTTRWVLD